MSTQAVLREGPDGFGFHLEPTGPPSPSAVGLGDIAAAARTVARQGVRLVDIELTTPTVQLRRLETMPPMSQRDLRDSVGRSPHRYFRLSGSGPFVTDAAWRAGGEGGALAVLAAAEQTLVESLRAQLETAGLVVRSVRPCEPVAARLNLAPPQARRCLVLYRATRTAGVLLVLGVGVLCGGAVRLRQLKLVEAQADSALSAVGPTIAAVRRATVAAADAEAVLAVTDSVSAGRADLLRTLDRLGKALPADVVLTYVGVGRDTVRLRGYAHSVAAVAQAIRTESWTQRLEVLPPSGAGSSRSATDVAFDFRVGLKVANR